MLLELNVRNIALIEQLRIEFQPGLNVLTGETGAGKSIVVDSMNLALGGRADRDLIRSGEDKAVVQAVFDVQGDEGVRKWLAAFGLEAEGGYVTLTRELLASGRNLCRVMGMIMPLSQLKALADLLVEMHGQHENQTLLLPANHMGMLDQYGDEAHARLLGEVRELHAQHAQAALALQRLREALREKERTLDNLERQLQEIAALHPKRDEDEKLEQRARMMENAEKISAAVGKAYQLIYQGTERAPSAQEAFKRALAAMQNIADLDPRFERLATRLDEMYYAAQDAGYELQDILEGLDFDPSSFDKLISRLDALERLKRKFGPTMEEVFAFQAQAEARVRALRESDQRILELEEGAQAAQTALRAGCERLSASRHALAARFERALLRELAELGLAKARFQVRFSQAKARLTASGMDEVEFMISANPGEPLKPLASTASGGELSRLMLAFKAVMAGAEQVETMIFDEIDTGISGRMAQVVGEKMARIGRARQVIAVSHLPQIAALSDAHFLVEKAVKDGRTDSSVRRLNAIERAEELARMVGGAGDDLTSGVEHARSMLRAAAEWKEQLAPIRG